MDRKAAQSRATLVDVARLANVSPATVSNAINNRRYVETTTKARIDAAIQRLGYTPNVYARRLRTSGIGTIGLFSSMPFMISESSRLGFLMEIAATAAIKALENNYALLLLPSTTNEPPRLDDLIIDGAIVLEPSSDDLYVNHLHKRGIPLVTIGKQIGSPPSSAAVDIQSGAAARLLFEHLQGQSAKHIALITGKARRNAYVETEACYTSLAKATGITPIIVRVDESGGAEAASVATQRLLADHPEIDGILALVDTFAVGTLRALADLHVSVPDTIRVATRYDSQQTRESIPPLTALDLHLDQQAALAIELLLERIQSGSKSQIATAPLPTLIPRRSTAL